MRIKDIIDCGREVQIVLKATREEVTEGHWHWHDEVEPYIRYRLTPAKKW